MGLDVEAQARYAFLLGLLEQRLDPPARLVELGAAPGDQIATLADRGYDTTAVDIGVASDEWADGTEGRMAALFADHGVRYVEWDLEQVPYPLDDGAYDGVVYTEVFEHLRDYPVRSLVEVARILRPGGFLFFSTPNAAYLGSRLNLLRGARSTRRCRTGSPACPTRGTRASTCSARSTRPCASPGSTSSSGPAGTSTSPAGRRPSGWPSGGSTSWPDGGPRSAPRSSWWPASPDPHLTTGECDLTRRETDVITSLSLHPRGPGQGCQRSRRSSATAWPIAVIFATSTTSMAAPPDVVANPLNGAVMNRTS